jgi:hypothetical protein
MCPLLQIENKAGNPLVAGKTRIIPFSQSVHIALPGFPGGMVWNRPLSILAVSANGDERVIRITDTTRRIQVALLAGGLLGGLLLWLLSPKNRKEAPDE